MSRHRRKHPRAVSAPPRPQASPPSPAEPAGLAPPRPEASLPVSAAPARNDDRPPEDLIRTLAYGKWEAAGRPPGDGVPFWLEAERELQGR